MPKLPPVPNTPLRDDPTQDSIWKRWLNLLKQSYSGLGTVTSVGLSLPTSVFDVSGSPVTSSGTLAATFDNQAANTVFAGPASGSPATPTFRTLSGADVTLTVGTTPIASGTAGRLLYEGPGNVLQESAGMSFDGTTLTTTGLSTTGNTTLGDASGDILTINAGTWTIGNDYISTRAAGTVANTTIINADIDVTFIGNSGGSSAVISQRNLLTLQGGNGVSAIQALQFRSSHSGTNTLTSGAGVVGAFTSDNTGGTTTANCYQAVLQLNNSGNITNAHSFLASAPSYASTGTITTFQAFRSVGGGSATLLTNFIGFQADNSAIAATLTASFRSQQNSGTGAWGYLHTGTANNAFNGPTRFGSGTVVPAAQVDVLQPTLGNQVFALSSTATNDDPNEIVRQQKVTTTDATTTTIATIAIPSTTTVMIEARVTARRTGGTSGTAEDGASYIIAASYKNVSGTATEIAESTLFTAEDQPGWNCTFTPSGSNALLQVTGADNNNVSWIVTYRTYSLSS